MEQKNEILNFLDIKNLFLKSSGGISYIVAPVVFSDTYIQIFTSSELKKDLYILVIEFKTGEELEIVCNVEKITEKSNYFCCYFDDPLPESFALKVTELMSLDKISDKRSEERFEIGLDHWQEFGLDKPECCFVHNGHCIKCIASNVSVHGILLIGSRSFARIGETVSFCCVAEGRQIKQNGVIISTSCITKSYFKYAVNFIEPINLSWIKLIKNYDLNFSKN